MADLMLSPKAIVDKEFQTKMRGYDRNEVDEFLDEIIKDYETFNKETMFLKEKIISLETQLQDAVVTGAGANTGTSKGISAKGKSSYSYQEETPATSATNFDILKRLSNLEREVFGKKLDKEEEYDGHEGPMGEYYEQHFEVDSKGPMAKAHDLPTLSVEVTPEYDSDENDLDKTIQF